jgi:protein-tyrosine phosphatase
MTHFRQVKLPEDRSGRLYLHSMPGRNESLEEVWVEVARCGIDRIVCLAPHDEVRRKSPSYASALERKVKPVAVHCFPIVDFGVPDDDKAFEESVLDTARHLKAGRSVLVHCGAGIGRTGLYAIATVLALGIPQRSAQDRVRSAGSGPERPEQQEALKRIERRFQPKRKGNRPTSTDGSR